MFHQKRGVRASGETSRASLKMLLSFARYASLFPGRLKLSPHGCYYWLALETAEAPAAPSH